MKKLKYDKDEKKKIDNDYCSVYDITVIKFIKLYYKQICNNIEMFLKVHINIKKTSFFLCVISSLFFPDSWETEWLSLLKQAILHFYVKDTTDQFRIWQRSNMYDNSVSTSEVVKWPQRALFARSLFFQPN